MPIASRRKSKQSKKNTTTLIPPNQHSSAAFQLQPQGPSLFENHIKMEETFNGTLQEDTHKVEDSLSKDKEVVLQVAADKDTDDGKSMSLTQTTDVDIAITDEHAETELEDVSESVVDSLDPSLNVSSLNEEKGEDLLSLEDQVCVQSGLHAVTQSTILGPSDIATAPNPNSSLENELPSEAEEPNSNEINTNTDVVSREVVEINDEKSDESDKVSPIGIEKSLVISTDEKVGEKSNVQESSSYESAKEIFQTSSYVTDAESNGVTQQGKIEEPTSFVNPTIITVTQRQHTTWKSCCGLLEILRHGDR